MTSKRHAKPTTSTYLSRIYRRQIALKDNINMMDVRCRLEFESMGSGQAMLSERMESMHDTIKILVDHCARLLREKETLMNKLRAAQEVVYPLMQENPIRWYHHCAVGHLHREGITCAVCGYMGVPIDHH
jgi:hypothetical protein